MTNDLPMADISPQHAWSGSRYIDMGNPNPEDFVLTEIACGLSREKRYGGAATRLEWSVGQHLLLCDHFAVEDDVAFADRRAILAHDFPEYMLRDIIRPLKSLLWDYKDLEDVWWEKMSARFGLPVVMPKIVHQYDMLVAACEKRDFISDRAGAWPGLPVTDRPIPVDILLLSNEEVADRLLEKMAELNFY